MREDQTGKRQCSKAFPKPFNNHETTLNDASYPTYRRRDPLHGGQSFTRTENGRDVTIDNSIIVPYNPLLSLTFNAHINVEVVQDVGAIKYLYKYVTKGSDKAVFALTTEDATIDEIDAFQSGRFVGAGEAFWRIYGFEISFMKPSVFKLALHLENDQMVLFGEDNIQETIENGPPKTHLTEFFSLVQKDPFAANLKYPDVCRSYIWASAKREWVMRKRNVCFGESEDGYLSNMVGRVPIVNLNPKQAELYFMRMLLYVQPGPRFFEHLRTVNGVTYGTYRAACDALNLLERDDEIDRAMSDAISVQFGKRLRRLFATLLALRIPNNPSAFWERHCDSLCEDFRRDRGEVSVDLRDKAKALHEIQDHLDGFELNLKEHFNIHIPNIDVEYTTEDTEDYDITTLNAIHQANITQLTDEQKDIYDQILDSVDNNHGQSYVLDAPGGTGKTFLLTTIIAALRADRKIVIATALSGLAATLLPEGATTHSGCKVPFNVDEHSTCNISPRDKLAYKFRECQLLIIDEFSMGHRHIYEAIDRTLRDIRSCEKLFGGLTVIFSGDWRQILPVVRRGGRNETVSATLKFSYIWKHIRTLHLTKNMRLDNPNDTSSKEFQELLMQIGNGSVREDENGYIRINPKFLLENNTLAGLCDFVYEGLADNYLNGVWLCLRAILCPKNDEAAEANEEMTKRFPGINRKFWGADKVLDRSMMHAYPTEFLNTINFKP